VETQSDSTVDRVAAEVWLRSLAERLSENGVIAYDQSGRVIAANDSTRRILGRTVRVGSSYVEQEKTLAFEGEDATPVPPSEHPVALALRGVETHDVTVFAGFGPDGKRIALLLNATPMRGEDGKVHGALLTLSDVGEARRAEAFREAFLARAGHELRNPLGALATATQILARRAKKRGDAPDRALEIVVESVQNLQKLVEELLDLSRIGRGRLELERQRVPLGPILLTAAEDARKRFADVPLETLVAGDIASGEWDPNRLRQAVRNLIENAIVHGKPPVVVSVVHVSSDVVRFCVRDHGEGVPLDRREEVLKPFVRRDRNVGMGLGLAIVTEIVRAHGGRFWLGDPQGGAGCAAFVELPIQASCIQ
jgi:signal transduction histidine kinase